MNKFKLASGFIFIGTASLPAPPHWSVTLDYIAVIWGAILLANEFSKLRPVQ